MHQKWVKLVLEHVNYAQILKVIEMEKQILLVELLNLHNLDLFKHVPI